MHPELFEIPLIHLTVKSYGTMMVVGFLVAMWVLRRMAKRAALNPEILSNAALYALISGVIGARLFYVIHYYQQFQGRFFSIFAVWQGGLEFLGGVILAVAFLLFYLRKNRLPLLICFDIFAVVLMIGSGFGRVGCLLNGCCYGKITDSPIGIRFPYNSFAYNDQAFPDPQRNRLEPYLTLDDSFFGWLSDDGKTWIQAKPEDKYKASLKPYKMLTDEQKERVTTGPYRCLKVLPTQLFDSGYTLTLAGVMFLFWRFWASGRPGLTMAMMMWLYGVCRFFNEMFRNDNPFEYAWWTLYKGGTISQNISLYMMLAGVCLTLYFAFKRKACIKKTVPVF